MALDATVAGASANSYLTVAAADALAAADFGPEVDAWTTATTELKEKALKRATREIDGYLRSSWVRFAHTLVPAYRQARLFPRAIDYTGTSPKVPEIPENVRQACYEQATYVLKNAAVIDHARTRQARDVQSASEPNLSFSERTNDGPGVLSDAALHFLQGYRAATGSKAVHSTRMSTGYAL